MGMTQSDMIAQVRTAMKNITICEHLVRSIILKGYVPASDCEVFEKHGFTLDKTDKVNGFVKAKYPEGWHISGTNLGRQMLVIVDGSDNYRIGMFLNLVGKKSIDILDLNDETNEECKIFKQITDATNKISSLVSKSYSPEYEYLTYKTYEKKNTFIGFVKSLEDFETIKKYSIDVQGGMEDKLECEYSCFRFPEEMPSGFIESLVHDGVDGMSERVMGYMMSRRNM
jgi:hypothetical protein